MGYLLLDLLPCSYQLSPEWLEEMIISGEADQSKPDVLPDFSVVPRMVLWCFLLEFPFLIVCVFVCVHDPHVVCERSHVVLPYRRVSVPVVGHFAHPQMLKRLLQRTNLNTYRKYLYGVWFRWHTWPPLHAAGQISATWPSPGLLIQCVVTYIHISPFPVSWWQSILVMRTVLALGT